MKVLKKDVNYLGEILHKLDKYYMKKYGITWADRRVMWLAQKGRCALCGKHERSFSKRLAIDHNHSTKRVRALLCFFCNRRRVGQLNLKWAKAVYEYLLKYDTP